MARRRWWPFSKINWFYVPAATFNLVRMWRENGPALAIVVALIGLSVAAALEYRARSKADDTVTYWEGFTNRR